MEKHRARQRIAQNINREQTNFRNNITQDDKRNINFRKTFKKNHDNN